MVARQVAGGFTLTEVLVALVLLSAGALALAEAVARIESGARAARDRERALEEAAWVLDSLVAAGGSSPGERAVGDLRVRWEAEAGYLVARVEADGVVTGLIAARPEVRLPAATPGS